MVSEPTGVSVPLNVPLAIGREYLRVRGLDADDIDNNHIEILPPIEGAQHVGWLREPHGAQAAIVFPYYGTKGQKLKYATVRFPSATKIKLVAPKGVPPRLYFPPMLKWDKIPSGAEVQIHESVIKAINAAKLGVWAIGLNGVSGGQSQGALVEDWDALDWLGKDLKPCIVFDSNNNPGGHAFNPQVRQAAVRLSCKLRLKFGNRLDVFTRFISEDPEQNAKGWGFDDWCVADIAAVRKWLKSPAYEFNIDPWTEAVSELNEEVVYVQDLKRVATLTTPHIFMTGAEFTGSAYANRHYYDAGGERKPAARAWLSSEQRNDVRTLVYRPGEPKVNGGEFLNLWSGMGTEPAQGDVEPFLELLKNLFPDPVYRQELLQWMAYPLQNLGAKMHKAVLIVGESGVGKSFIGETLSLLYGDNAKKIRNKDFQTNFNSNLSQAQFGLWEEATLKGRSAAESESAMQNLKDFVTGHTLPVEAKGRDVVHVENCCNVMILTNDWDKFDIQHGERRFFALEARQVVDRKHDSTYWRRLISWRDSVGAAALYWHLLHDVDCSTFEPHAPAMETRTLDELRRAAAKPRVTWVEDNVEDLPWEIMTAAEVESVFQRTGGIGGEYEASTGGSKEMGNALQKCGFKLAADGAKIKMDGNNHRFYVTKKSKEGYYTSAETCRDYLKKRGTLDSMKISSAIEGMKKEKF